MCLGFLAPTYLPITYLGEYIDIDFDKGALRSREIYDVVFCPPADMDIELLCISPHNVLHRDGSPQVETSPTPGTGNRDDEYFYAADLNYSHEFDSGAGGLLKITVPVVGEQGKVVEATFAGLVVEPRVGIPRGLDTEDGALDFMVAHGTLFSLALTGLKADTVYAMRLIVSPVELLNLPNRMPKPTGVPGQPVTEWVQYATVMDPKTCRYNCEELLKEARELEETRELAAKIQTKLAIDGLYTLPIDHHRIAILVPPNCELSEVPPIGNCMSKGPTIVARGDEQPRMMSEWISGRAAYPNDDLEYCLQNIWGWLDRWSHGQSKSKESITTAITAKHHNVSLLVDCLVAGGLLNEDPSQQGRYCAVDCPVSKVDDGIWQISTDRSVISRFDWQGYVVRYALSYPYLRPADRRKLESDRRQLKELAENAQKALESSEKAAGLAEKGLDSSKRALRWAIFGTVLALVGIMLAIGMAVFGFLDH